MLDTFLPSRFSIFQSIFSRIWVVGVVLLFFWGPPVEPISKGGEVLLLNSSDKGKAKRIWSKHQFFSRTGLVLILIGFSLQLIGTL